MELYNFNPRTPCGVRRVENQDENQTDRFQSTHPLRGATIKPFFVAAACLFQSTHPLRGATRPDCFWQEQQTKYFNPRTPCGVRQYPRRLETGRHVPFQSTHPLRGATMRPDTCGVLPPYFNPRTPCGVRLQNGHVAARVFVISIHAPLAGCDSKSAQKNAALLRK